MSSNTRPQFYDSLDVALQRKGSLLNWIEAIRSEAPHIERSARLDRLRTRLLKANTAEDVVSDPVLATWIPVLLDVTAASANGLAESTSESHRSYDSLLHTIRMEQACNRSSLQKYLYPFILMVIVLVLLGLMAGLIVPSFQRMFREFQLRLPITTKMVFGVSDFMINHPFGMVAIIFLLATTFVVAGRLIERVFPWTQTSWLLGTLTAGNTGNLMGISRLIATTAELLDAGATVPQALQIGGIASQRLHLRQSSRILAMEIEAAGHHKIYSSVAHIFPPLLMHALGLSEHGTASVGLLRQLAKMYAERTRNRAMWMSSFINPIAILLIGFIVGFIVIALFMPLFSLVTVLS